MEKTTRNSPWPLLTAAVLISGSIVWATAQIQHTIVSKSMGSSFNAPPSPIPLSGDRWVVEDGLNLRVYQAEKDNRIRQVAKFTRRYWDEKGYFQEAPDNFSPR